MKRKTKVEALLAAHTDTVRVDEAVVRAIPAPKFTGSWRPYSHATVLDCLTWATKEMRLEVDRREYSINEKGTKMFGVWQVKEQGTKEACLAMGIRNSVDKSMAVGLCAGERVFVCDNLVLSSDFVLFRKHTGQLVEDEIRLIAKEAIVVVLQRFEYLQQWHDGLHEHKLTYTEASLLTVAAMKQELIPPSQYEKFYELFLNPKSDRYDLSYHGFHGAITELIKERNLMTVHQRNDRLNKFINFEVPLLLQQPIKERLDLSALHTAALERAAISQREAVVAGASRVAEVKQRVKQQVRAAAKSKTAH